ncbi:carboxypeptidase regulatory-like domain-containing protein [Pyxidicoccus fallax]|uniref:S8 family serine peptidase n=1 Tax=Pyxidicoccus fallax TaxID=394095 RepID=A0A848LQC3_9BACT|nr:carboxypeptidase regulatory-like domain-containing protein [Pyxidicoccus fallax]NMO19901.1 S8 family serine peptidase [Pyxidicoccus fallax]
MKRLIRSRGGQCAVVFALLALLSFPLLAASTSPAAAPTPRAADPKQKTSAWLILKQKADLSRASTIQDWNARGRFVVEQLQATARTSQAGLRGELNLQGVSHRPIWIINAIRVDADATTLKELARRPEVDRIVPDVPFHIPKPRPGVAPGPGFTDWNIERIRAPEAWGAFGSRGEGITVGSIDSGAQFDHPALARQYRGRRADGTVDHNYNWFDPSNVCGSPSQVPCDNNGHGTHTMGTIVGDDGEPGPHQIGVAPGARWVTAKGCEEQSCSVEALLASAQWMLAPTDLSGGNPRPDLRPQLVNNSWSGGPTDPFFRDVVQAWIASGIFPVFAIGNDGSACGSAGIPGAYPESYSVGAFDTNEAIAGFSGRGPSAFGGITKPDITAPGVSVLSSVPGGDYAFFDGTSMAAPHVAGTVALMLSAAPALVGDVAGTRALLDASAVDREDLTCAGTAEDNNAWGEGTLDAFAAVQLSPRGPTGVLTGVVTDASGSPLAGARVEVTGSFGRSTVTDDTGRYSLVLPVGTYRVTFSRFGSETVAVDGVVVSDGGTTVQDIVLPSVPSYTVTGRVTDSDGAPIPGATVTVLDTPLSTLVTGTDGRYVYDGVPVGEYDVRVEAGGCFEPVTRRLVVAGPTTLDFTLPSRSDAYGYFCRLQRPRYIEATTVLPLSGDDATVEVALPFSILFYGRPYTRAFVSTNGLVSFQESAAQYLNTPVPNAAAPNAAIYALWDDLFVDASASVRVLEQGTAPNRRFIIEWRDVAFVDDPSLRVSFEIILHENGNVLLQYRGLDAGGLERGGSATVGIENEAGTVALQFSSETPSLRDERAILFDLPPYGVVLGTVTDANDGLPLVGARVRALVGERVVRETTSAEDGRCVLQLPLGTYTLQVSAPNYLTATGPVTLTYDRQATLRNWALRTARAEVAPAMLEFIVPQGQRRTRTLTLSNTGSVALDWELFESGGGRVGVTSLHGQARNLKADPNSRSLRGLQGVAALPGWTATLAGDVLKSWPATGLELPWGVGFTGNVWLSDPIAGINHEFTEDGGATGRTWPVPWTEGWPADMAYDAGRGLMCQLAVGGDNGIHCWNPATGLEEDAIAGTFPWTSISQRGLAYRPDDDTFYVGGWNEGIIYHVKGLSHPDRGAVIGQCSPPDGRISGLAWNASFGVLWVATQSPTDTLYEVNPETCNVLGSLAHPEPDFSGGGLELDAAGNLWMVSLNSGRAYLVESGVPTFEDVPWLSAQPTSGRLGMRRSQNITVTIDTTGLEPGVYLATLYVRGNSGRRPVVPVPVSLIVPAYQQAVNAGGSRHVDTLGDPWAQDQQYVTGGWGYLSGSDGILTDAPIAGTVEDPLYQSARRGFVEYRFDNMPSGVYAVDLRFAEIEGLSRLQRLADVVVENSLLLPAHDIANEVGQSTADDHAFLLPVTDGQLVLRLIPRQGFNMPLINAVRLTQRPDR